MGDEKRERWFESRVRWLLTFGAAVAAVVLFLWASQARQDEKISANDKAVAVVSSKLDALQADIEEVKTTVTRIDGKLPVALPTGVGAPELAQAKE